MRQKTHETGGGGAQKNRKINVGGVFIEEMRRNSSHNVGKRFATTVAPDGAHIYNRHDETGTEPDFSDDPHANNLTEQELKIKEILQEIELWGNEMEEFSSGKNLPLKEKIPFYMGIIIKELEDAYYKEKDNEKQRKMLEGWCDYLHEIFDNPLTQKHDGC
ncbi:MAG: hypothetical protein ABIF17_02485 [Patescibacteria group bacterium]